jgi:hypothetical protein
MTDFENYERFMTMRRLLIRAGAMILILVVCLTVCLMAIPAGGLFQILSAAWMILMMLAFVWLGIMFCMSMRIAWYDRRFWMQKPRS